MLFHAAGGSTTLLSSRRLFRRSSMTILQNEHKVSKTSLMRAGPTCLAFPGRTGLQPKGALHEGFDLTRRRLIDLQNGQPAEIAGLRFEGDRITRS